MYLHIVISTSNDDGVAEFCRYHFVEAKAQTSIRRQFQAPGS